MYSLSEGSDLAVELYQCCCAAAVLWIISHVDAFNQE